MVPYHEYWYDSYCGKQQSKFFLFRAAVVSIKHKRQRKRICINKATWARLSSTL